MNVLWTYMLTRLQRYACDFVRWILYITLHTINLKAGCQMHFIACSQVHSWLHSIAHSQPAWLYAPNCSRWHTPSLCDLCSQVSPQDAPKYTPGHALKDAPNCIRWHTPSQHDCALGSKLSRRSQAHSRARSQLPIALDDTLPAKLDCTLPSKLSRRSQAHSRAHSQLPIALDDTLPACLTIRSQVSSQDTPKYTPETLISTPSTFSCTLPGMLSRTLTIALDGTLPACLTIRSQVSSQDAPKYTPSTFSSTLPGMLSQRSS